MNTEKFFKVLVTVLSVVLGGSTTYIGCQVNKTTNHIKNINADITNIKTEVNDIKNTFDTDIKIIRNRNDTIYYTTARDTLMLVELKNKIDSLDKKIDNRILHIGSRFYYIEGQLKTLALKK